MTRIKTIVGNAVAVLLAALALAHFFVHPGANGALVMGVPKAPAESVILADGCDFGGRHGGTDPLIPISDSASVSADTAVISPPTPATPGTLVEKNGTSIHDLGRNLGGTLSAQGVGAARIHNFPARTQVMTELIFSPVFSPAASAAASAKGVGEIPAHTDPPTDHSGMPPVIGLDYARFPFLAVMLPTTMPTTMPTMPIHRAAAHESKEFQELFRRGGSVMAKFSPRISGTTKFAPKARRADILLFIPKLGGHGQQDGLREIAGSRGVPLIMLKGYGVTQIARSICEQTGLDKIV